MRAPLEQQSCNQQSQYSLVNLLQIGLPEGFQSSCSNWYCPSLLKCCPSARTEKSLLVCRALSGQDTVPSFSCHLYYNFPSPLNFPSVHAHIVSPSPHLVHQTAAQVNLAQTSCHCYLGSAQYLTLPLPLASNPNHPYLYYTQGAYCTKLYAKYLQK